MERTSRSDLIVRFYLSMFSVYRVVAKKISKSTFYSITLPPDDVSSMDGYVLEMRRKCGLLVKRYMPWISSIPLKQGLEFVPSFKSVPNTQFAQRELSDH